MGNLNLPPFYTGQKVVYLTGVMHPKNSTWTVLQIRKPPCLCSEWIIDIGLTEIYDHNYGKCKDCGTVLPHSVWGGNIAWYMASSFAPIESTFQSITFEKVIEIESSLIGIN